MAVPYWMNLPEVREKMDAIEKGQEVEIEVRDNEAGFNWIRAKAIVSQEPIKGGGAAALLGPFGELIDEGKWFVKIVEELPILED